jgi:hypothetical protein
VARVDATRVGVRALPHQETGKPSTRGSRGRSCALQARSKATSSRRATELSLRCGSRFDQDVHRRSPQRLSPLPTVDVAQCVTTLPVLEHQFCWCSIGLAPEPIIHQLSGIANASFSVVRDRSQLRVGVLKEPRKRTGGDDPFHAAHDTWPAVPVDEAAYARFQRFRRSRLG